MSNNLNQLIGIPYLSNEVVSFIRNQIENNKVRPCMSTYEAFIVALSAAPYGKKIFQSYPEQEKNKLLNFIENPNSTAFLKTLYTGISKKLVSFMNYNKNQFYGDFEEYNDHYDNNFDIDNFNGLTSLQYFLTHPKFLLIGTPEYEKCKKKFEETYDLFYFVIFPLSSDLLKSISTNLPQYKNYIEELLNQRILEEKIDEKIELLRKHSDYMHDPDDF